MSDFAVLELFFSFISCDTEQESKDPTNGSEQLKNKRGAAQGIKFSCLSTT
jgi:hypothetical protein